jgi:hypothetical protein
VHLACIEKENRRAPLRGPAVVALCRRADTVDDAVQVLGGLGIAEDATVKDEGYGVEEAPRVRGTILHLLEGWVRPLLYDLGDAG